MQSSNGTRGDPGNLSAFLGSLGRGDRGTPIAEGSSRRDTRAIGSLLLRLAQGSKCEVKLCELGSRGIWYC